MNIFKDVKAVVSTREAAAFYGIKIERNGMCCCPFHNDRHPSMKTDKRYYCFGCGEKGDVIDFVAKLFALSPLDAARKLAKDFNINTKPVKSYREGKSNSELQRSKKEKELKGAFQRYTQDALFYLHKYREKLLEYKEKYLPDSPEELADCHPLYEEAVNNLDKIEWMIDELTFENIDENINFFKAYKGDINHVKNRLRELV
ncbi:MAG: DNA primase [Lachnospiraceae bacterium]|nr:DNA primase [Lachnospiraceae bacterium]